MTITWLGHSCFKLESQGYSLILDPYSDGNVPGLAFLREEANMVLMSHNHNDHNAKKNVQLVRDTAPNPFRIQELHTFHDEMEGALRGDNTIHIINDGTYRVAHLGALGCSLDREQEDALQGLDVLMVPVGGYYTIDAVKAHRIAERLIPKIVIPMHFRGENYGYNVLESVEEFLKLRYDVVRHQGNTLVLKRDTPWQTAVFTYKR